MKRFIVFKVGFLILIMSFIGFSQEQKKVEETVDDLLIKVIEYMDTQDGYNAADCLKKAVELDPKKEVYLKILGYIFVNGKFTEALQLLAERKNQSPSKKELKVIKILTARTHFYWAKELGNKYDYINALDHYYAAYCIDEIYDLRQSAVDLDNIGLVYIFKGQNKQAMVYFQMALKIWRQVRYRKGEVTTLNNIAAVYNTFGQKQKALEYLKKCVSICRELKDQSGEGILDNNIGKVYSDLGQNKIALEYYEKALQIFCKVRNHLGESETLNNIGSVYFFFDQYQIALEYHEKALPIFQKEGNRPGEANTLNNIGVVYSKLGQREKALEYFDKALFIHRDARNLIGESRILNNIGIIYLSLGQKQKALEYFEMALPIIQKVEDRSNEATCLNNIGSVYNVLDQNQKALEYFEKVMSICLEVSDHSCLARTLSNIGIIYSKLEQKQKSLEYHKKALLIHRKLGERFGEALSLNNIGGVYLDLSQKQKAQEYLEKSLLIFYEVGEVAEESTLISNIGWLYSDLGQKQSALAIFYGKQAVNMLQQSRQNIDNLDIYTKLKYLRSKGNVYRSTASLLILSGRVEEAQQVLDFLKDEEYFSFVLQNRSAYTPQCNPIDYTEFEQKWINRQNILVKKMFSISNSYNELVTKPNKNQEEKNKMEVLKHKLDDIRRKHSVFLTEIKKEFETYKYKKNPDIKDLSRHSDELKKFLKSLDQDNNGRTVSLQFFVYKGRISVLIITPSTQIVKQSPFFNETELNIMIYKYRDVIEKLSRFSKIDNLLSTIASPIAELFRQKREIENKLYSLVFLPVDDYLKQYGAVNLLVSLDGVLRYIPLGALWDGEHYLTQKYRFILLTPSSLKQIDETKIIENKILGMCASKGGNGFKQLLYVDQEIRDIVNDLEKGCSGLINGNALIDNDFTRIAMFNWLETSSHPIVHIASHFQFSPGDETKNHLLLGDGTTISLSDIRNEGKLFDRVKLLVLSACQTGVGGNGEEIDGFGELAQQCGARSVIASLWPVDDESTKELMVKFYSLLKEGNVSSTIEALRLAQLELAGLEDLLGKDKNHVGQPALKNKKYSNPYYWAPFVMIGKWR